MFIYDSNAKNGYNNYGRNAKSRSSTETVKYTFRKNESDKLTSFKIRRDKNDLYLTFEFYNVNFNITFFKNYILTDSAFVGNKVTLNENLLNIKLSFRENSQKKAMLEFLLKIFDKIQSFSEVMTFNFKKHFNKRVKTILANMDVNYNRAVLKYSNIEKFYITYVQKGLQQCLKLLRNFEKAKGDIPIESIHELYNLILMKYKKTGHEYILFDALCFSLYTEYSKHFDLNTLSSLFSRLKSIDKFFKFSFQKNAVKKVEKNIPDLYEILMYGASVHSKKMKKQDNMNEMLNQLGNEVNVLPEKILNVENEVETIHAKTKKVENEPAKEGFNSLFENMLKLHNVPVQNESDSLENTKHSHFESLPLINQYLNHCRRDLNKMLKCNEKEKLLCKRFFFHK